MRSRKGFSSAMDALIFIAVIGIAASMLFVAVQDDHDGISAKDVCDDLFGTTLKVSDVFDIDDSRTLPMQDIIAIGLQTGDDSVNRYLYDVLRSLIPAPHGFVMECVIGDMAMTVSYTISERMSEYGCTMPTICGPMSTTLTIG